MSEPMLIHRFVMHFGVTRSHNVNDENIFVSPFTHTCIPEHSYCFLCLYQVREEFWGETSVFLLHLPVIPWTWCHPCLSEIGVAAMRVFIHVYVGSQFLDNISKRYEVAIARVHVVYIKHNVGMGIYIGTNRYGYKHICSYTERTIYCVEKSTS